MYVFYRFPKVLATDPDLLSLSVPTYEIVTLPEEFGKHFISSYSLSATISALFYFSFIANSSFTNDFSSYSINV